MHFKPFGDYWFYISRPRNPDQDELNYIHQSGEFNIYAAEGFEKHLNRYLMLNKFYHNENGNRLKYVIHDEPAKYPLSDLIYHLRHNNNGSEPKASKISI